MKRRKLRSTLVLLLVSLLMPLMAEAGVSLAPVNSSMFSAVVLGGHKIDIVVRHPSNPSVIYASGTNIGIYKSTNGGVTWSASNAGFPLDSNGFINVTSIAIDPSTPSILYAGIQSSVSTLAGVYKSTDSGLTWGRTSYTWYTNSPMKAITIDPVTPSTIYVLHGWGVVKSTNSGTSWMEVQGGTLAFRSLAIDPVNTSVLYAYSDGIYKSMDGGVTWVTTGLYPILTGDYGLYVSPTSDIYVGTTGGLYKSTDGGANWTLLNLSGITKSIVADPVSPQTLYFSSNGIYKSIDGGASFITIAANVSTPLSRTHLVLDHLNSFLYVGIQGKTGTAPGILKIDFAAPEGTIVIDNNAPLTKTTAVTLSLTCTNSLPCTQMQFSDDGYTWDSPIAYTTSVNRNLATGADGTRTVYALFKDSSNSLSNIISDTITLDTISPVATSFFAPANNITTTDPLRPLMYGYTEAGASVVIKDGGNVLAMLSAPNTVWMLDQNGAVLTVGTHTFTATVTDAAGNTSPESAPLVYTVSRVVANTTNTTDTTDTTDTPASSGGGCVSFPLSSQNIWLALIMGIMLLGLVTGRQKKS